MSKQAMETRVSDQTIRELYEVTSARGLSFQDRLRTLLSLGCRRFQLPIGLLTQVREGSLEIVACHPTNSGLAEGVCVPLEQAFCSATLTAEGPIAFEHAGASEWVKHPAYETLHLEAYLGTRVMRGEEVYGTLCFTSLVPYEGRFTTADKDWLQLMSRWVESELEREQAEAALVDRNRLLNLDAAVGRIISQGTDLQRLLQECTEALVAHLDAAFARIWTLNAKEQTLELQASAGMYTNLKGRHSRVPVGQFKIGKIAADKKPHLTNAVIGDPRVHDQEWAKREGMVAFAGYPLLKSDEVIGVMALFARHRLTHFTLEGLKIVADRITVGVERQTATDALRALVRHHRLILASAGEGIYGLDHEGRTTFVNPAAAKMLGYEERELLGQSMHAAIHHTHPDGSPYVERDCPIYAAFSDGTVHHVETEMFWRKDGTRFPVEYTSTPIWEGDCITGAVVTFRDIAERRQAEQALLRSEHLLRSIINNTSAVIYVKWADGRYLMINSQFEKLFHISADQMRGKTDYDVFPEEIADTFRENDRKVLQTKAPIESEEYAPHDDGLHAYFSLKFPLFDASGAAYATCGISTDITDLKRAQAELHKSEAKTIRALQQSDTLKTALLDSVSHELRTPLASIQATVTAIMGSGSRANSALYDELLQGLNQEIDGLSHHVDNLLNMSRVAGGLMKPRCEPQLFEDLLEGPLRRFEPELKNRKLEVDLQPDLPLVLVDSVQIQLVLVNLIDNAIKYSAPGSPIAIKACVKDEKLEVRLRSMGEVIPSEDLSRIFERFYRVEVKRGRPIRGTGLGLAICRSVVECHGGRIWAESPLKWTTVIVFTLPLNPSSSSSWQMDAETA